MLIFLILSTFSLIDHVQLCVCLMLPQAVSYSSEALISLKRITTYLCLPEIQQSEKLNRSNFVVKGIDIELNIENLCASYGDETTKHLLTNGTAKEEGVPKFDQNVLTNINLNCKPGELIVIVGPVGKCQLEI